MVAAIEPFEALLPGKKAAKFIGLSEGTLRKLAKRGEIPAIKEGRAVRYDPADLRGWRDQKKAEWLLVVNTSIC